MGQTSKLARARTRVQLGFWRDTDRSRRERLLARARLVPATDRFCWGATATPRRSQDAPRASQAPPIPSTDLPPPSAEHQAPSVEHLPSRIATPSAPFDQASTPSRHDRLESIPAAPGIDSTGPRPGQDSREARKNQACFSKSVTTCVRMSAVSRSPSSSASFRDSRTPLRYTSMRSMSSFTCSRSRLVS